MNKAQLKAEKSRVRAKYYLALTSQINDLLESALKIDTETLCGHMYADYWRFADDASRIEQGIVFLIRDWMKEESRLDLKTWTVEYFNCPGSNQEINQESEVTTC